MFAPSGDRATQKATCTTNGWKVAEGGAMEDQTRILPSMQTDIKLRTGWYPNQWHLQNAPLRAQLVEVDIDSCMKQPSVQKLLRKPLEN